MRKLTTAGDGTWILATDRGRTWFAKWHKTTPSVSADATSFGSDIFKRLSMIVRNCSISSLSSFWRSNSRRMVKLNFSAGTSRFQDTFLNRLRKPLAPKTLEKDEYKIPKQIYLVTFGPILPLPFDLLALEPNDNVPFTELVAGFVGLMGFV